MKGYKGFKKGLICRGKQYAENTIFDEDNAEICKSGMHFCENPFDVLDHYGFVDNNGNLNEFCEVEALDEVKTDDKKKFCTKKLKIGAKLGITGLINEFVKFTLENIKSKDTETNTGDYSAATNTGDYSAATNTGNCSAAIVNGKESFAIATGVEGKVKGSLGCFLALAEWGYCKEENRYKLVDFQSRKVDGLKIKPDTFYMLKGGEFVEAEEDKNV